MFCRRYAELAFYELKTKFHFLETVEKMLSLFKNNLGIFVLCVIFQANLDFLTSQFKNK